MNSHDEKLRIMTREINELQRKLRQNEREITELRESMKRRDAQHTIRSEGEPLDNFIPYELCPWQRGN